MGRPPTWRRPGPRRLLLTPAVRPARGELLAPWRPSRALTSPAGPLLPLAPPTPAALLQSRRDSAAEAATAAHGRPARIPPRPCRACVAEPRCRAAQRRKWAWPTRLQPMKGLRLRKPVCGHVDGWQDPEKPRGAACNCECFPLGGRKGRLPRRRGDRLPPVRHHSGREPVHRRLGKLLPRLPGTRVGGPVSLRNSHDFLSVFPFLFRAGWVGTPAVLGQPDGAFWLETA